MIINSWKMDFDGYSGLECTVPCDMYSVLYEHKCISDPYYGTNEEELCPLSLKDAVFYSSFSMTKKELDMERADLIFYGLDTICEIYLNGTLIDNVKNMHRKYVYDVKALLKQENEIRLEFKSPLNYFQKAESAHHLYMNGDTIPGASHLRKAFYMSGWDWAPMLPNMGIFRPVELRTYDADIIEDIEILQIHENGKVTLDISATTKHSVDGLTLVCEVNGQRVEMQNGRGNIDIENPRLWWPNGYGEQNLYKVTFYLYKGDVLLDCVSKSIGLRSLTLSQENDEDGQGREFCFKINGVKIFAMGANYVPIDCLLSRLTKERTEELIKSCIFANFNCIRVWGGAFYPDDYFYDLCDKYGLLVWQDFMVACANILLTPDFENEFTKEAIYNIKRIRHHASLALLCGNNEMEEAICYWEDTDGNDPLVRKDYLKLYEDILPRLCAEHAPQISYTPSSPTSGGNFENPKDETKGDVHFWDVWNGNCQFDEYRKHKFRFCSEYGFESLPSIKTIYDFCPPCERNLLSYTMENHQKHWHGNVKLLTYLAEQYKMPKSLEATVYATQINQASAIKFGVEHFRRCRGYTMGSIYWQLNDCWPVASWSSIDYFGRYKALHYFARKFYQPVSLGLFNEEKEITVNVANEQMTEFSGYIKTGVMTSDFTVISEDSQEFVVAPLSSLDVKAYPNKSFYRHRDRYFYAELYDTNGSLLAINTELGTVPKHFEFSKPTIKVEADDADGGVMFTLSSDVLAKNVEISFKSYDIALSDNYFDLCSTKPYKIFANTDKSAKELLKDILIMSVYDISHHE